MVKVKQINNLKIMQDKEQGCYLVINPEGKTVYKSVSLADIEQQCKEHKEYLVKGKKEKETHDITVDFISEEAYKDTYVVSVPMGLTKKEVERVLQEAAMLYTIAESEVNEDNVTEEQIESAKSALECYGNCPEAFMVYINECYGWKYRRNAEADFKIYY